jgi:crotonobetainyl-CoA:carnitine CoA-transferase CaiB-like acyl-CoA transferase
MRAATDTQKNTRKGPLDGVRVIDVASFLAGPIGAMFLADYGADVIKVERPDTGDESRFWGNSKNGVGLYYKVLNRNKRSVTADLRTALGVEILKRLVKTADILVENFGPVRWNVGVSAGMFSRRSIRA